MKNAIKLAIEGGYGGSWLRLRFKSRPDYNHDWKGHERQEVFGEESTRKMLLDPLFWQSLGKAMGWEKRITGYNAFTKGKLNKENNDPWRLEWHRFIDKIAEGGTADEFFEELLK